MDNATLTRSPISPADVAALGASFRGRLVGPEHPDYAVTRRVWNAQVDRFPALIAQCSGVADIAEAIRFAREREIPVSVRGGGHSIAGNAIRDRGLVIDLSLMKGVRVDPGARRAFVQGGALWGDVDRETQVYGLATPGGVVSHTGVGGLTLGGGIGWLMRKYGVTVDNLRSVNLVTADGTVLLASERENADLFWGLRGGGGNFGVAAWFEYQLHQVGPTVTAGSVFFDMDDAVSVLRQYRDWIRDVPDEVTTIVSLRLAPPMGYLPENTHGRPVVYISVCHCGTLEAAERDLAPLRSFAEPIADHIRPKPFTEHQTLVDAWSPPGWHYYWSSCELPPFTDEMIDILVERGRLMTAPKAKVNIYQLGGAISRIADDATAFYSDRGTSHNASFSAVWSDEDGDPEPIKQWARESKEALGEFHLARTYVNFQEEASGPLIRRVYGSAKHDRLVELKRRYDPTNFFNLNPNIVP